MTVVGESHLGEPESLDALAGRVAHDLNNLLTVITSFGTFVAEEISAAQRDGCAHLDNAPADVQKVLTAAERGAELTGQLLSRIPRADTDVR
ncbi:hypothetical protein [Actinokineospora sp. NBRC 105648]|uniref:hypothetical protein n=1 Tax=Actinokineospora sp. NBRC 105648 TaxID=3032206 RepID=UPI0024A330D2|nr:hypothetical protein [Actinokineospora sp. NBRC 105648]GLZ38882.1 hypothetical protein Acsp05_25060 [Actinokineospora sp. NBRC 105648]